MWKCEKQAEPRKAMELIRGKWEEDETLTPLFQIVVHRELEGGREGDVQQSEKPKWKTWTIDPYSEGILCVRNAFPWLGLDLVWSDSLFCLNEKNPHQ